MRSFEELMAAKNAAGAVKVRSFEEILAAKQASEAPTEMRAGRPVTNFPQTQAAGSQFSTGEQLADVGRAGMGGVSTGAEFLTDVAAFPITMTQRGGKASQRFREADGMWESIKAYGSGFMEPTEFGKGITEMFEPASRMYAEQIGEGEGDAWLDPLKTGARITGELASTGVLAGGGRAAPIAKEMEKQVIQMLPKATKANRWSTPAKLGVQEQLIKTAPLSITGGVAGQELGGDIGEVVGIISGAVTPSGDDIMRLGGLVVDSIAKAPKKLKRLVRSGDTAALATDREIRKGLQEILRHVYTDDPDLAISTVDDLVKRVKTAVADGKKGTLGQLSGDAGILEFEKSYAKEFRKSDIDTINMQLSEGATAPMEAIAPEGVTQRAGGIPAALTAEKAKLATEAESLSKKPFTQQKPTPEASTALHETTSKLRDDSFDAVKKQWDDIGNPTVAAKDVKGNVKAYFKKLNKNLAKQMKDEFGAAYTDIEGLKGEVDFKTISGIISRISLQSKTMSGEAKQHIDAVQEALYDALGGTAEGARKQAAGAYKAHMQKFGSRSQVGKALDQPPERFGATMISGGDIGVSKRADLIRSTGGAVEKQSDDFLRAEFNAKYVDQETGLVSAGGVNAFKKKYGNQLSDEMVAELDKAQVAARDLARVDKSLTAELGATDDILATAKSAMTHKKTTNRVDRLTELLADVDQATPKAREDIKRMFAEDMFNTVTKDGKLTQAGLTKFKRNRDVYEKSGLFTKDELDRVQDGMEEGQKMFLHEDAKLLGKLPAPEKRVAEVLAALGGAKVGAMAFGSPLIGAALGRRFAVKQLREIGTDKINKIAFELSMNPAKFVKEIARLNKPNITDKESANAIVDLWYAALAASRTAPVGDE